ncbi:MAG: hypothetical protein NTZ80_02315 [Patescibacteria group bacterium]|nr:hypothetical protein [Patescibacteria group bacterium]
MGQKQSLLTLELSDYTIADEVHFENDVLTFCFNVPVTMQNLEIKATLRIDYHFNIDNGRCLKVLSINNASGQKVVLNEDSSENWVDVNIPEVFFDVSVKIGQAKDNAREKREKIISAFGAGAITAEGRERQITQVWQQLYEEKQKMMVDITYLDLSTLLRPS